MSGESGNRTRLPTEPTRRLSRTLADHSPSSPYPAPDSNGEPSGPKPDASASWASGAHTGGEIRTLRLPGLGRTALPVCLLPLNGRERSRTPGFYPVVTAFKAACRPRSDLFPGGARDFGLTRIVAQQQLTTDLLVLHGMSRSTGSTCKPTGGPDQGASLVHSSRGRQSHSPGSPKYERQSMRSTRNSQARPALHLEGLEQSALGTSRITRTPCDKGLATTYSLCGAVKPQSDEEAVGPGARRFWSLACVSARGPLRGLYGPRLLAQVAGGSEVHRGLRDQRVLRRQ